MIFLQLRFIGLKIAKTKGWHKCVEFGGNKTKRILFISQCLITSKDMWLARLSPITTLGPFKFQHAGKKYDKNQSSKIGMSNHPLSLQLQPSPSMPPSIHVGYICLALYTV